MTRSVQRIEPAVRARSSFGDGHRPQRIARNNNRPGAAGVNDQSRRDDQNEHDENGGRGDRSLTHTVQGRGF